jgi:hypothetical protein
MANENLLKIIVNGLENLAADNEILCELLNLRALVHGFDDTFEAAPFTPPARPYRDVAAAQARAAEVFGVIADNTAFFVLHLGGDPASPATLGDPVADADLLRLVIDWGTVQSGVQKAIVQLYGRQPNPPPGLSNPGAASEERLWAEIVAWAEKIAADSTLLTEVQHFETAGSTQEGDASPPLAAVEQAVQRTMLNSLRLAALLPHHLYHAAHPSPPAPQYVRARSSKPRAKRRKARVRRKQ